MKSIKKNLLITVIYKIALIVKAVYTAVIYSFYIFSKYFIKVYEKKKKKKFGHQGSIRIPDNRSCDSTITGWSLITNHLQ